MANPGRGHWDAMKKASKYLSGTSEYSICYHSDVSRDSHLVDIQGYVDSDWARDVDKMRSTSRYVFRFLCRAVSWMSKQQVVLTLSNTKTEYMVATNDCKKAIWLMKLCSEIGLN